MTTLESPLKDTNRELAVAGHPVWAETKPFFTPDDFNNPYLMDVGFLRWLVKVRKIAGVPMWLNSDARKQGSDIGAEKSAHEVYPCRAIDGQVRKEWNGLPGSEQLARIVIAAVQCGCVRIGIYKSKNGLGDIYHLDAESRPENPSPRMWTKW